MPHVEIMSQQEMDIFNKILSQYDEITSGNYPEALYYLAKMSDDILPHLIEDTEFKGKLWVKEDGNIFLFCNFTVMHGSLSFKIALNIHDELVRNSVSESSFVLSSRFGCLIGKGYKEFDFCLIDPKSGGSPCDGEGNVFPSLVGEISVSNETETILSEILEMWTGPFTSVSAALGIKIFEKKMDGSQKMVLLYKSRGIDCVKIEFGTDVRKDVPNFFEIPINSIIPSLNNSGVISINLQAIRSFASFKQKPFKST